MAKKTRKKQTVAAENETVRTQRIITEYGKDKNYKLTSGFVPDFLRENAGEYYTAKELAEFAYSMECFHENVADLPEEDAILRIARVISSYNANYESMGITVTASRPHKYTWTEAIVEVTDETETKILEKDLYPVLTTFCEEIGIKTLRINEHASILEYKNKNKWLHPDVVGYKDAAKDLSVETKELLQYCNFNRVVLYAFEVKRGMLKKEALKEAVLETTSNSSWANYAYLVAEDIDKSAENELRLLCESFKIGFISLNKTNPDESEILIEAPHTALDWGMINRIAVVNTDFAKYIRYVVLECERHTNRNTEKPKWDTGLDNTEENLFKKAAPKTAKSNNAKGKSKKGR